MTTVPQWAIDETPAELLTMTLPVEAIEPPPTDWLEVADPGYLEDAAAQELYNPPGVYPEAAGAPVLAGGQAGECYEVETAWGGDRWTVTCGSNTTVYFPTVYFPTASTTGTYTLTYNGQTSVPLHYYDDGIVTCVGAGGGGSGTTNWNNYTLYNPTADWNNGYTLYNPPNVFPGDLVDQPWTQEQATREWLSAERAWVNEWLCAEKRWQDSERIRQRQVAKERAHALLFSLLPEPERQRYTHEGFFEVIGSHGGHYRIHRGVAGNIIWLHPDGKPGSSLCCHPNIYTDAGRMPDEDAMIGQLLALRTDEASFVRTANGRKPPHLSNAARLRERVLG
jgi:hypothetical protein